jgi:hypothetical protein
VKYILIVIYLFLSPVLYSQNLEPKDIDIFINHYGKINIIFEMLNIDDINSEWREYRNKFYEVANNFFWILSGKRDMEFDELKDIYQEVLNYKIPEKFDIIFTEVGWENDGNKKLLTIWYGYYYFQIKDVFKDRLSQEKIENIELEFLKIFDENDLTIINDHIQKLNELNELVSN